MTDSQSQENNSQKDLGQTGHQESDTRGAGVKIPPPLVFVFCLAIGWGLQALWPVSVFESVVIRYIGTTLSIVVVLALLGVGRMFSRHKTSIEPWKPTTQVMSHGPYAHSRNPIYVGFCFLTIGIGLALNSIWISLSFIPAIVVVYHTAIVNEEKYLEKKFGEEYRRYKDKVRRWL